MDHQLYGIDGYLNATFIGPYTIVIDFNAQAQYYIPKQVVKQCFVLELNKSTALAGVADDAGMLHLNTFRDHIFASDQFSYSYEGVTNIRDIPVEGWSSIRDNVYYATSTNLTNGLYEIFFTKPGWQVNTPVSSTTNTALWRATLSGNITFMLNGRSVTESISWLFDFSGFSTIEPPVDVFDVSRCLHPSDYVILTMAFPVSSPNDAIATPSVDLSRLTGNLRKAILNYATSIQMPFVSPLQISAIQVGLLVTFWSILCLYYCCT